MKGLAGFYIPPPLTAKKFTIAGEEYIECECIKEAGALVRKESKHTGGLFNHGLTSDCRALWWTMFMRKLVPTLPCTCSPQHWHCGDRTRLLHIHRCQGGARAGDGVLPWQAGRHMHRHLHNDAH